MFEVGLTNVANQGCVDADDLPTVGDSRVEYQRGFVDERYCTVGTLYSSSHVLCRDETPRVSDLGPSALSSGVPDDSLLIAGGLQLPSHFPKGGAQGWNRTWDLVDMEPKHYSMCYRASLSELVLELAH